MRAVTTDTRHPRTRPPGADREWADEALAGIWQRRKGLLAARLELIREAVENERADPRLLGEARRAAHTLAGSLPMFGYELAADAARGLERELATAHPRELRSLYEILIDALPELDSTAVSRRPAPPRP
jgi:chemotaxis protein histidine kinase CheA